MVVVPHQVVLFKYQTLLVYFFVNIPVFVCLFVLCFLIIFLFFSFGLLHIAMECHQMVVKTLQQANSEQDERFILHCRLAL